MRMVSRVIIWNPRLASPRYGLVARGILKVHAGLTAAARCAILATVAGSAPAISGVDARRPPADLAKSSSRAGYQLGGISAGTRRFRRDARPHMRFCSYCPDRYIGPREAPMNVQLPVHMDKAAFLEWVQGRDGRFELANGQTIMLVGASRTHGLAIVRGQLDPREWSVIADFGLDAGPETLRYPDIVIDRAGGSGGDLTASAPALVIEVLSPSSLRLDLGDKAAEYLRLPSLRAYLVFAQDEPKAWAWTGEQTRLPPAPAVIGGQDKIV
ncbi:MAG: Uma2 family endonuclease [Alphaproteobacteria bacterium]|nr:MAG: Uma2 family endonuclease [Alphaproteobacteria bacterium]